LDADDLRRAVRKGDLQPAYYFHGEEDLLKDEVLRELLEAALDPSTRDFNLDRRRAGDLTADDFATLALTPPMLAARRAVVISDVEVMQQKRTKMQALRTAVLAYLRHPSPETVLVLVQSAPRDEKDARPDAELARHAATVAFVPLPPERLRRWILHHASREGLTLDEEGADVLRAAVGDDLAQIAAEITKLRSAVGEGSASADDVADLVGVRRGETVHDFVDAVTARRFAPAAEMVPHLLNTPGVSGVRLVSSLATVLTGVALARALLDQGTTARALSGQLFGAMQAARPMGLRKWGEEAERWARDAATWSSDDLDRALAELLRADRRLKAAAIGGEGEIVADAILAMADAAQAA
jgi:DNA polymerase-3 subunit delta